MISILSSILSRFGLPFSIQNLSGGTVPSLLRRFGRLRAIAGAMVQGTIRPPLPVRLQIENTDICNLQCIHCNREVLADINTGTIPLNAFTSIVECIDPFYVTMNGLGEPLLDKTIFQKLDILHKRGVMTSMPTNGTYIRRRKLQELSKYLPDILQLSIDGATKQSFEAIRKPANFENTIANYRSICAMKADGVTRRPTSIRILCALQRLNMGEYREMYHLYRSLRGVDEFCLTPVFDFDPDGRMYDALIPNQQEVLGLITELDRAISLVKSKEERSFYINWRNVTRQFLSETKHRVDPAINTAPCLVPWFSTYIDAKGQVYPCCYLPGTEHVMGVAKTGSEFAAIWEGEKYRAFRLHLMQNRASLSGCRTCPRNDARLFRLLRRFGPIVTFN